MSNQALINRLKYYNKWRRGEGGLTMPYPKNIGRDLDEAIRLIESMTDKKQDIDDA